MSGALQSGFDWAYRRLHLETTSISPPRDGGKPILRVLRSRPASRASRSVTGIDEPLQLSLLQLTMSPQARNTALKESNGRFANPSYDLVTARRAERRVHTLCVGWDGEIVHRIAR